MGVLLNKPSLATVATSGSYADLSNKPDVSVVKKNNTNKASVNFAVSGNTLTITTA